MKKRIKKFFSNISFRRLYILVCVVALVLTFARTEHMKRQLATGEYGHIEDVEVSQEEERSGIPSIFNRNDEKRNAISEAIKGEGASSASDAFLDSIPEYSEVNRPAYAINNNKPEFTDEEYERAKEMFVDLPELDYLGRCGTCMASLGKDTLAEGERDFDLSHVKPSGWKQAKYEGLIENDFLYNRCHLIMYAVSGITDDARNLVTGTRYMNTEGMLSYSERAVQNYIVRKLPPGDRILYRVTPVFQGAELVCRGVHIEAADIGSRGSNFHINVFCYNVQPGVGIDYATGKSWRE